LAYERLWLGFISASPRWEPIIMTLDQLRRWPALAIGYRRAIAATAPKAVIHTNWHHALLLLPFLDPRRDIYWAHELFPDVPRYRRMVRMIASRVARVVCVSHAVARSVLALGVPADRVTVVHNGVPAMDLDVSSLVQPPLRLGIVGQVAPWKGHEDLLDALALLFAGGLHVKLIVFGEGNSDYIAGLKDKVARLGLQNAVEWRGFVAGHDQIFSGIDVCVAPSRIEEAFGMTAVEAGTAGRPVICSNRGGLPEIVENGVTGFVVEAERPDRLAQAIAAFVHKPDLVRTMGEAARKRVRSAFSLDSFVAQVVNVVEELSGDGPPVGIVGHAS
jgi:glycosyltransferase involved in cell wall biosynthesis